MSYNPIPNLRRTPPVREFLQSLRGTVSGSNLAVSRSTREPEVQKTNAMKLGLSDVSLTEKLSFHFMIAENSNPEPIECSTWYAVDFPHKSILALQAST